MGFSSVPESQSQTQHKMKFLIALCLVASAMAIEDTAEVAAAKAAHAAAFAAAEAGEHAALAPADVAAAKAAFMAAFDSAEKIAALPAPYFYNGYYGGAFPYAGYGYAGYPYAGYGYAGYPYVLPAAAAAKEE